LQTHVVAATILHTFATSAMPITLLLSHGPLA